MHSSDRIPYPIYFKFGRNVPFYNRLDSLTRKKNRKSLTPFFWEFQNSKFQNFEFLGSKRVKKVPDVKYAWEKMEIIEVKVLRPLSLVYHKY